MDYLFTIIFFFEAMFKIIGFGLVLDEGSYLTDDWSKMDIVIVIFSLVDVAFSGYDLAFIKILRLLRILRPLRFISHNPKLKMIVIALMESVGGIFNVVIVIVLIWMMFAIFGMNLMGGKLDYCDIDDYYKVSREECAAKGETWKTRDFNFDNIFNAMITLFIVSTLEAWPDIMFYFVDGDLPESGPSYHASEHMVYFFIFFIVVGSMFLTNLFVGVISLNYNMAEEKVKNKDLTNI
jgi:hypothetical protein